MRVALDLTLVRPDRMTGVERYAVSLAAALARRAAGELVLLTRPDAPPAVATLDVEQRRAPFRARVPVDQAWVPAAALAARADLLHTLAFPTPVLWRGRAAMTVHDATPWLHPGAVSTGMRLYYRPLYPQALRRAAVVFTVSHSSARDLAAAAGVPPARLRVTPNGIGDAFFAPAPAPGPARRPYLLAVGTLEPRKNLPTLLAALRLLRVAGRDLELVLVGRQGWAARLPLGELAPHVRLAGAVDDAALAALYAGAACYVLPSSYEGFGLPLGEAMAAGAPAVASDLPALRELGGDEVLYAPPGDPGALAVSIAAALDEGRAAARVARARCRARRFTWEACAEATLAGYREVLR